MSDGAIVRVPPGQIQIFERLLKTIGLKRLPVSIVTSVLIEFMVDYLRDLLKESTRKAFEWEEIEIGDYTGPQRIELPDDCRVVRVAFDEIPDRFYVRPGREAGVPDATVLGAIAFRLRGGWLPETRLEVQEQSAILPEGLNVREAYIWVQVGAPGYSVTAYRQRFAPAS